MDASTDTILPVPVSGDTSVIPYNDDSQITKEMSAVKHDVSLLKEGKEEENETQNKQ